MIDLTAHDQLVRELDRTSRRHRVEMALKVAPARGDEWIVGGPADWSKDELINYLKPARS
jgi:hypothetical protein